MALPDNAGGDQSILNKNYAGYWLLKVDGKKLQSEYLTSIEGQDTTVSLPCSESQYIGHCVWACIKCISNKPSVRQEHLGVPDGSNGSNGTSYPLTVNQMRLVTWHSSSAVVIIPCLVFLGCVALYVTLWTLAALMSGFIYFASGIW
jgi:hypothetical protein